MKKSNFIMILLLWTIPEILLANYLQDIWNKDFMDSLILLYWILITLWILKFLMSEISFRLFWKNSMIDNIYYLLVKEKFPNPWNYYVEDGISYFEEVWWDVNNELLETRVINQATTIFAQTKLLYDMNKFGEYWRIRNCLKIAVKRFMNNHFKTSVNNLNLTTENLLEIFTKFNFINPNELEFNDPLKYIDLVILSSESFLLTKLYAIKIRYLIWKASRNITYNESEYWIDESSERNALNWEIEQLNTAIEQYSQTF